MAELFLDRIDGEVAVLLFEDRELHLPRTLLPAGAQEGEVLQLSLVRDPAATERARKRTGALRSSLGEGDDGGDVKL